jgi:flagellar biosynthesis/type III secretory pathway ATPase
MRFERYRAAVEETEPAMRHGRVRQVMECEGLSVPVGARCEIQAARGPVRGEVVGFRQNISLLMPLGELEGVSHGDPVVCLSTSQRVEVGPALLGRVIDSQGQPLDEGPPVPRETSV